MSKDEISNEIFLYEGVEYYSKEYITNLKKEIELWKEIAKEDALFWKKKWMHERLIKEN